jgi:hypothetical protein
MPGGHGELAALDTARIMQNGAANVGSSLQLLWWFNTTTIWPLVPGPGSYPRETKMRPHASSSVAVHSSNNNSCKEEANQLPTSWWMGKQISVSLEWNLSLKRNAVLLHNIMWRGGANHKTRAVHTPLTPVKHPDQGIQKWKVDKLLGLGRLQVSSEVMCMLWAQL